MNEVVIVDSGGANLASLSFAFARLGCCATVTNDGATIASAERIVLPGVGAARPAMTRLQRAELKSVVQTLTQPVIGICLGMQILFERSEEGETPCLGILPGVVRPLTPAEGRPVPHMGWNTLKFRRAAPLLEDVADGEYAYFVHRFMVPVNGHTLASTEYGETFAAVVRHRNFWGTQFHPERSSRVGAQILRNFLRL